ncbi:MAG: hypothetical protein KGZ25_15885, partial [Planctomycetes bacterium]|nr:hypothetical protein [Planctomycetota bacterium]
LDIRFDRFQRGQIAMYIANNRVAQCIHSSLRVAPFYSAGLILTSSRVAISRQMKRTGWPAAGKKHPIPQVEVKIVGRRRAHRNSMPASLQLIDWLLQ